MSEWMKHQRKCIYECFRPTSSSALVNSVWFPVLSRRQRFLLSLFMHEGHRLLVCSPPSPLGLCPLSVKGNVIMHVFQCVCVLSLVGTSTQPCAQVRLWTVLSVLLHNHFILKGPCRSESVVWVILFSLDDTTQQPLFSWTLAPSCVFRMGKQLCPIQQVPSLAQAFFFSGCLHSNLINYSWFWSYNRQENYNNNLHHQNPNVTKGI